MSGVLVFGLWLLGQPAPPAPAAFLNATAAQLRTLPAGGAAPVGELRGGSEVLVVQRLPNGWHYVDVAGVRGYLYGRDLVSTLDSVSGFGIDMAQVRNYVHYRSLMTASPPAVAITPAAWAKLRQQAKLRQARPRR